MNPDPLICEIKTETNKYTFKIYNTPIDEDVELKFTLPIETNEQIPISVSISEAINVIDSSLLRINEISNIDIMGDDDESESQDENNNINEDDENENNNNNENLQEINGMIQEVDDFIDELNIRSFVCKFNTEKKYFNVAYDNNDKYFVFNNTPTNANIPIEELLRKHPLYTYNTTYLKTHNYLYLILCKAIRDWFVRIQRSLSSVLLKQKADLYSSEFNKYLLPMFEQIDEYDYNLLHGLLKINIRTESIYEKRTRNSIIKYIKYLRRGKLAELLGMYYKV